MGLPEGALRFCFPSSHLWGNLLGLSCHIDTPCIQLLFSICVCICGTFWDYTCCPGCGVTLVMVYGQKRRMKRQATPRLLGPGETALSPFLVLLYAQQKSVCLVAVLWTGGNKMSSNHWSKPICAFSPPGRRRQTVLGLGRHLRMSGTQVPSSFLFYHSYRFLEGSKLS